MGEKLIICIGGLPGCGKSTVARRIAEEYGLRYISGGSALKELAIKSGYKQAEKGWWESKEGMRFLERRIKDLSFDMEVDRGLLGLAKDGNIVFDSWTMPWLLKEGFKIWLDASLKVRAERVAKRDGISLEKAEILIKKRERETKMVYQKLYGFKLGEDFSPFHLIMDTDLLNADEVFNILCFAIENFVLSGKFFEIGNKQL